MNDGDRQAQREAAARKLLDAYAKLVEMTALEIVQSGGEAKRLTEAVARMTENQAKAMLIARIGLDALRGKDLEEQIQAAPFGALRDDPDLD
jgi:hypothetical protein